MIKRVQDIEAEEIKNPKGGKGAAVRMAYQEAGSLGGEIKMLAVMDLQPDSEVGYHMHENDAEIYLILDGKAVINDNGEEDLLGPGDMLITNKGEFHSISNKSASNITFLAIIVE